MLDRKLTDAQADWLNDEATRIRAMLGCGLDHKRESQEH